MRNEVFLVLLFFFYFLIFLASTGGHTDAHDGVVYLAIAENMAINHSAKTDPYAETFERSGFNVPLFFSVQLARHTDSSVTTENLAPAYTGSALMLPAIASVLYKLSLLLSLDPIHFVPYFLNPTLLALSSVVLFLCANEIFVSKKIAFILSLAFAVTSFAWPYVSSMFTQPLVALLFISAFYFVLLIKKNKNSLLFPILCGLFVGLTILAHPGYVILTAGFVMLVTIELRRQKKIILVFAITFLLTATSQGLINYARFGSLTDFGYGEQQSLSDHTSGTGILGLLFSPGFGLIVNYPLFILFPFAIYLLFRYYSKSIAILCSFMFVASWIFFGTLETPVWSGFGAWGPRYLLPILPFITLPIGAIIKKYANMYSISTITILGALGFTVNLLGVLVWYQYGYSYGWSADQLWKVENSYDLFAWNFNYIPAMEHFKLLKSDYLHKVPEFHQNDFHMIGLAPCQYDNFVFCNFGLVPVAALLIIITVIFFYINKEIIINKKLAELNLIPFRLSRMH